MKNKVRVGGKVSRQPHKLEEDGSIPSPATKHTEWGTGKDLYRPTFYNMRTYPAGFTVQEADRAKMRPFWKELGVMV